ncbi:MAG: hypothetical protein IJR13_08220 [Bacteroidales bacterium]|nr:hypothetical protein [Bacteroidales bacterium]
MEKYAILYTFKDTIPVLCNSELLQTAQNATTNGSESTKIICDTIVLIVLIAAVCILLLNIYNRICENYKNRKKNESDLLHKHYNQYIELCNKLLEYEKEQKEQATTASEYKSQLMDMIDYEKKCFGIPVPNDVNRSNETHHNDNHEQVRAD